MTTIDELEREHTLLTAAHRYDDLRLRHTLLGSDPDGERGVHLPKDEALELLALGEVLSRKASYGRQLAVRAARAAGATWSQIATATGVTKQSAWEAHQAWIQAQADAHRAHDWEGFSADEERDARRLAGSPD